MNRIRILIVDDHAVVRTGLKTIIECEPDMTVVGEADNGEIATALVRDLAPDVVVMDLRMPGMDGAESTRQIVKDASKPKVLILTSFGSHGDLTTAIRNGAAGAMLKDTPNSELITAIRAVSKGEQYFHGEIAKLIAAENPTPKLTDRQLEILQSCMQGFNTDEIAQQFGISRNGVKKHVGSILSKLGASNRSEAITIAIRQQQLKI